MRFVKMRRFEENMNNTHKSVRTLSVFIVEF
jgi:hypothetical protein